MLIRPVHKDPIVNDILPKLANAKYLTLIDANVLHQNRKFDEKLSFFTTLTCQFGRFWYAKLTFGGVSVVNML